MVEGRQRSRHQVEDRACRSSRRGIPGLASVVTARTHVRTHTAPRMRVAALISGGKDSCYNMMQCIAEGHQIVALANLRPDENQVESDELDSYMYQTVGHHAIDLYAEAMALPLYRRAIRGRSLETGRVYTQCEGDEVEDLYELLKLVKVQARGERSQPRRGLSNAEQCRWPKRNIPWPGVCQSRNSINFMA
ncbi:diphthine--ammonia ligase isoform X1 [Mus musculus]|uniref:diphthine--ammonia ligase isoform X1 n=1 Tax=Mus musculus TaxID=10090 RepID=UPI0003D6F880|nr:diphthine--ammonia ligase isoform X1 [Mus musculus]|eukprot:XP_006500082.1 PREDICTED: diphthine--ammonia ligase isoform X2 [Mus musculus]